MEHFVIGHVQDRHSYSSFLPAYGQWEKLSDRTDVSVIDIFISSSGNFNIITLDHMKKLKNIARSTWLL